MRNCGWTASHTPSVDFMYARSERRNDSAQRRSARPTTPATYNSSGEG